MENSEEGKPSRTGRTFPTPLAYYSPQMAPPPYYSPSLMPGQVQHSYAWPSIPPMMPLYGPPYAAVYPHGGLYPNQAIPVAAASLDVEAPNKKSSGRKFRKCDKLLASTASDNGNAESAEDGNNHCLSRSAETEGSSCGSDGCTTRRKRSRHEMRDIEMEAGRVATTETHASPPVPASVMEGKLHGKQALVPSSKSGRGRSQGSPLRPSSTQGHHPSDSWFLNERELKREKRKQSNRESARRSRLRKQAEAEELAHMVKVLTTENMTLKSEVKQLTRNSEKLRLENAALMVCLRASTSKEISLEPPPASIIPH